MRRAEREAPRREVLEEELLIVSAAGFVKVRGSGKVGPAATSLSLQWSSEIERETNKVRVVSDLAVNGELLAGVGGVGEVDKDFVEVRFTNLLDVS